MVRTGLSCLALTIGLFLLQACEEGPPSDFAEAEAGAEDWPGPIEDEPPLFST